MLFLEAMRHLDNGEMIQEGSDKKSRRFKKMNGNVVCFEWETNWVTGDITYFIAEYAYVFNEYDAEFDDWQIIE